MASSSGSTCSAGLQTCCAKPTASPSPPACFRRSDRRIAADRTWALAAGTLWELRCETQVYDTRRSGDNYTYFYRLGQKDRRNGTDCQEHYVVARQLEAEVEDLNGRIEVPADWAKGAAWPRFCGSGSLTMRKQRPGRSVKHSA